VGLVSPFFCQSVDVCTVVRRVAPNGLQLGEVAKIEAQMFSFAQNFNRRAVVNFTGWRSIFRVVNSSIISLFNIR